MVWWAERIQFMQKVQNTFGNCRFLLILLLHDDYGDVGLWAVSITKMIFKKMLLWPQFCDSYQSYLNSLWTGMGHIRCFCPSNRLINVTWLSNSVIFTFSGWSVLLGFTCDPQFTWSEQFSTWWDRNNCWNVALVRLSWTLGHNRHHWCHSEFC